MGMHKVAFFIIFLKILSLSVLFLTEIKLSLNTLLHLSFFLLFFNFTRQVQNLYSVLSSAPHLDASILQRVNRTATELAQTCELAVGHMQVGEG